ncbi:hypothetical protein Hanom_Chr15g01337631 [Helianthus anomalus]
MSYLYPSFQSVDDCWSHKGELGLVCVLGTNTKLGAIRLDGFGRMFFCRPLCLLPTPKPNPLGYRNRVYMSNCLFWCIQGVLLCLGWAGIYRWILSYGHGFPLICHQLSRKSGVMLFGPGLLFALMLKNAKCWLHHLWRWRWFNDNSTLPKMLSGMGIGRNTADRFNQIHAVCILCCCWLIMDCPLSTGHVNKGWEYHRWIGCSAILLAVWDLRAYVWRVYIDRVCWWSVWIPGVPSNLLIWIKVFWFVQVFMSAIWAACYQGPYSDKTKRNGAHVKNSGLGCKWVTMGHWLGVKDCWVWLVKDQLWMPHITSGPGNRPTGQPWASDSFTTRTYRDIKRGAINYFLGPSSMQMLKVKDGLNSASWGYMVWLDSRIFWIFRCHRLWWFMSCVNRHFCIVFHQRWIGSIASVIHDTNRFFVPLNGVEWSPIFGPRSVFQGHYGGMPP